MENPIVFSKYEMPDSKEPLGFALWGRMGMTSAQKKHYNNPDKLKKFKCIHCRQEMEFLSKFSKHVKNKHMDFTYGCVDCGKSFSSESALNTHKKSVNSCGGGRYVQMYQCQDCDKSFTTPHSRAVHSKSLVNGKCPGQRMKEKRTVRNALRNAKLNDGKAHKRKAAFVSAKKELASARGDFKKKSRAWKRLSVKNDSTDIDQHRRDQCDLDQCDQCDRVWQSGVSYTAAEHVLSGAKGQLKTAKKKYGRKYQLRNLDNELRTLDNQLKTFDNQLRTIDNQLRTLDN